MSLLLVSTPTSQLTTHNSLLTHNYRFTHYPSPRYTHGMKLLFLGDIVGRTAREAVIAKLPALKSELAVDVAIINAENSAGGFGVTPDICTALFDAGADCITTGDHVWDQKSLRESLANEPRLLRPANFPATSPGHGMAELTLSDGRKALILHLHGQVFMKYQLDDPFAAADALLNGRKLGTPYAAIFVDMHAEATSEKCAMGHYLDGRVSAVVGSHTHIPTADTQILPGGTGYQTDAGMCGDYNSVIGFEKEAPLYQFTRKMKGDRMKPANGEPTLCGTLVATDDTTGHTTSILAIRRGGRLQQQ